MNDYEMLMYFDRESDRQNAAVMAELRKCGRPDLAEDLERKLADIRSGVDGARKTWEALSMPQRRVMSLMGEGRWLSRPRHTQTRFYAYGPAGAMADVCGAPTVRNLMERELVSWETGRKVLLTEHGRFVLAHGQEEFKD